MVPGREPHLLEVEEAEPPSLGVEEAKSLRIVVVVKLLGFGELEDDFHRVPRALRLSFPSF